MTFCLRRRNYETLNRKRIKRKLDTCRQYFTAVAAGPYTRNFTRNVITEAIWRTGGQKAINIISNGFEIRQNRCKDSSFMNIRDNRTLEQRENSSAASDSNTVSAMALSKCANKKSRSSFSSNLEKAGVHLTRKTWTEQCKEFAQTTAGFSK